MTVSPLGIAAALIPALILPWLAQATPSLEYGPEAEARFVEDCIADPAMTPAGCRMLMEALQRRLGYAGFLEFVARRPDAAMVAIPLAAAELLRPH